jgi:tetratricopeptide (TPR) repeat protein
MGLGWALASFERGLESGRHMRRICVFSSCVAWAVLSIGCSGPQDLLERGNQAFAKGQYEEASLNYRKAIQKNPQFAEAYWKLGTVEFRQGQFGGALASLERAVQLKPVDDAIRAELADAVLTLYLAGPGRPAKLYDRLTQLTRELLAKNPNSFDGLRFQASLLYMDGHIPEAIELFRKANVVKPMQPEVILPLVEALKKNSQLPEAESLARDLVGQRKDFEPIYDWLYSSYQDAHRAAEAESILASKVANNPQDSAALIQLARHYHKAQKPAEMEATLDKLVNRPKDFPNRYLLVGDFHTSIQNWDAALHSFETGAKADAKEAVVYQERIVNVYLAQRKVPEALGLLDKIIKEYPDAAAALRTQRATIYVDIGDDKQVTVAIAECLDLIQKKPDSPTLKFLLGRAYLRNHDQASAIKEFRQAAGQAPTYLEPRLALAELSREHRDFRETVRLANEVLAIDNTNFRARVLRASGATGLGNFDIAQAELTALNREYPNSPDVALESGLLTMGRKQYAAAEQVFLKLTRSEQTDYRALAGLVQIYIIQKQYDRAIELVTAERRKSPASKDLHVLLAATALLAGKLDLALAEYQRLTELAPQSVEYLMSLAEVYRLKGDYTNEAAVLERASNLSPGDGILKGRLALAQDVAGRKPQADLSYQQSLKMLPTDPALQNNRAFFMAENGGNLEEALQLTQEGLRKLPNNPNLLDTLGWIYTKRKMNDTAIQVLDGLVRKNPDVSAFRYHLATALYQKGEVAKAREQLEGALTKRPSPEEEGKIRDLMGRIR